MTAKIAMIIVAIAAAHAAFFTLRVIWLCSKLEASFRREDSEDRV